MITVLFINGIVFLLLLIREADFEKKFSSFSIFIISFTNFSHVVGKFVVTKNCIVMVICLFRKGASYFNLLTDVGNHCEERIIKLLTRQEIQEVTSEIRQLF